ncbi:hypothetical protein D355_00091 [Enterococcus faecium SD1C-2]|nr:hypothetical protein D355_00091 [Enterococcus faecium SD1C-2]EPI23290.1 hypothetical protein D352_01281 [Enterococcus faecium LA4B-2]
MLKNSYLKSRKILKIKNKKMNKNVFKYKVICYYKIKKNKIKIKKRGNEMVKAEVGRSYICKPIGVSHELIGCIERTYINTAVVYVESYDQRDYQLINESKYRMLVKFCDISAPAELVS